MPPDEVEEAVEEFLEGQPRAAHLADLRRALLQRLEGVRATLEHATDPAERQRLVKQIDLMERQVEALAREELITEFVEGSVRATASWSHFKPEEEEGEA